jgi:putative membrane protein
MRGLLIRFTVTGIAVFLASQIVPGITVETVSAGVAAVILLAFLNAIVRPILYLFTLPFIILSLGLFMVVVNALLLHVVAWLVKGFVVEGFWPSVWGALIISVTSTILTLWVSEQGQVEMVIHRKPPRIIN